MSEPRNVRVLTKSTLSEERLKRTLAQVSRAFEHDIDSISELAGGFMNSKYVLNIGGHKFVLKMYSDHLAMVSERNNSRSRARAEYRALQACAVAGLPAPRANGFFGDANLLEFIDGVQLLKVSLTESIIDQMAEWQLRFHELVSHDGKGPLGTGIPNGPLLASWRYINQYATDNPGDNRVSFLSSQLRSLEDSISSPDYLLRGDAGLSNWHLCDDVIYGLDLEFCSMGDPALELGMIVQSICSHNGYSESAFNLAQRVIDMYSAHFSSLTTRGIRLGLVCAFILSVTSVPIEEDLRQDYFDNARYVIERFATPEAFV